MSQNNAPAGDDQISQELDALSCDLLGSALDALAAGVDVLGIIAVEDERGTRLVRAFSDDGPEACLAGARDFIATLAKNGGDPAESLSAPQRYALVYEGAVERGGEGFGDALILEFGERNHPSFSAYVLWKGFGAGEGFMWADPEPAGEVDSLI